MKYWPHVIIATLLALAIPHPVRATTGLASRCDAATAATQAAACTGSRTFVQPASGDYILSYPTVPADSTTVAWTDANLQFRQWVAIPGNYGVQICTKDLTATQVTIPVGGADQCAPGPDAVAKVFVAASTVTLAAPPVPVAVVNTVSLDWGAPTANTDGSALTTDPLTGYGVYQGSSAATLAKVATVALPATSYTTPTLAPGTYYFAVTAITATAESAQIGPVSAIVSAPPAPKVPGAPTNLKITVMVTAGP